MNPDNFRLAINTHDNDFSTTMRGLFRSIGEALEWSGEDLADRLCVKESVAELVGQMIDPHYLMYQRWDGSSPKEHLMGRIPRNIYINEEVDALLRESLSHGGELTVLDMRIVREQRVYTL